MEPSSGRFGALVLSPAGILYAVFLVAPISFFLVMSVFKYDALALYRPEFTVANFARLITDPYYRNILALTLKIAGVTTLASLLVAYPLALFLARTRSVWRGVLLFLVIAPLMTGVIVRTYGWIVLLGSEGLVNNALVAIGVIARPLLILNSQTAVVIALVHILMPYMVFPLFSALAAQDPDLERAASTLGAGRLRTFLEVTLPLSRSGIVMGSVLVFTLASGAVVTPALLGGKNVQMLGQMIYDLVLHTLNWPLASALAFLLVLMQLLIIILYFRGSRGAVARAH